MPQDTAALETLVVEALAVALDEEGFDGEATSASVIYGPESPLDSTALVSLIVDIEDRVRDTFDADISLADERAVSQERSPFRDVPSMVAYIQTLLEELDGQ